MSNTSTLITLGILGIGGYFFVTKVWPMLEDQLADLDLGGGGGGGGGRGRQSRDPEVERILQPIIEDRVPDVVYEDRYPDVVVEDRYPDYYPVAQPYPVSVPTPYPVYLPPTQWPLCPAGRYWNGDRCKKVDIDCPPGYREDDGVCERRDCNRNEFWNGHRCENIPRYRDCDRDEFWNGNRCERINFPRPRPGPFPRPRPDCDRDGSWNGNRCVRNPSIPFPRPRPRPIPIPPRPGPGPRPRPWPDRGEDDDDELPMPIPPRPRPPRGGGDDDDDDDDGPRPGGPTPRCPVGSYWDVDKCKVRNPRTERRFNTPRDRWHDDRDAEEDAVTAITGRPTRPTTGPESRRVQQVAEKALQSFLEVYYA